jgi:hypothetical protein
MNTRSRTKLSNNNKNKITITEHTSANDLICEKCNTEYKVNNNNKDYDCTPEKCSVFETCEGCDTDINCHRENIHILTKNSDTANDLTYCFDCCQNRNEAMLNDGWKCDECDSSDDDNDSDNDK